MIWITLSAAFRTELKSKRNLHMKLEHLVRDGCVAVILEIVRQCDGRVLTQREWNIICVCCQKVGIYLIVDECLTAIRCGAPFAHHLPQYREFKPSFVIFGKALISSGIAVYWDGVHISRLGYTDSEDILGDLEGWDHKSSRVLQPMVTIQSLGTIRLAERERWWDRSTRIGENLLLAQIWRLQNYKIEQRGSQHVVQNNDNHDVGKLWFNGQATTAEDCVVVGMQDPDNYLILLVSKTNDHHYQRVGAGQIKACCLSKDPWEGAIV
jgi:hypothetical protein